MRVLLCSISDSLFSFKWGQNRLHRQKFGNEILKLSVTSYPKPRVSSHKDCRNWYVGCKSKLLHIHSINKVWVAAGCLCLYKFNTAISLWHTANMSFCWVACKCSWTGDLITLAGSLRDLLLFPHKEGGMVVYLSVERVISWSPLIQWMFCLVEMLIYTVKPYRNGFCLSSVFWVSFQFTFFSVGWFGEEIKKKKQCWCQGEEQDKVLSSLKEMLRETYEKIMHFLDKCVWNYWDAKFSVKCFCN